MTIPMDETAPSGSPEPKASLAPEPERWATATLEDVAACDLNAPLGAIRSADCHALSKMYLEAARRAEEETQDPAAVRVYSMVSSVLGMLLHPYDKTLPFTPFTQFGNARSAAPEDFRGCLEVLQAAATKCGSIVVKARMLDLIWLLDRKRGAAGRDAVTGYLDTVDALVSGNLSFNPPDPGSPFDHRTEELLARTMRIAPALGRDKPEMQRLKTLTARLREHAWAKGDVRNAMRFAEVELVGDFGTATVIGASLEEWMTKRSPHKGDHANLEALRMAGRAFHVAGQSADSERCRALAAEELVLIAEASGGSAITQSHFLSEAIAELAGLQNVRDRRQQLKERLLKVQGGIADEMHGIATPLDTRALIASVRGDVSKLGLVDKLFYLASIPQSPELDTLIKEAQQTVKNFPLTALMGTTHHDHAGKVLARTHGGLGMSEEELVASIHRSETNRRQIDANAIHAARMEIVKDHYIAVDFVLEFVAGSPLIDPRQARTFAEGITLFLQGDILAALYILVPLLENCLRHVLIQTGVDVSTLDDGSRTQEDRSITQLMEQFRPNLEDILSSPIVAEIDRLFLARPGPALRHSVCHGLLSDADAHSPDALYACAFLFALCLNPLEERRDELKEVAGIMGIT